MEELDLPKEQRRERLKWVFYGVGAMFLVVSALYMRARVEMGTLHAYGLTVLTYGALIYVEEFDHLRRLWLWKAVVATLPLHIMSVAGLLWWDAKVPQTSEFIFGYRVWPFFVAEMVVFTSIIDHFKASASPDEPRRKLTRFLNWTNKPKRETREIITIPDENGEVPDFAKEARKNHLKWSFFVVSALLIAIYFLKSISISGTALYIVKASLLTMLSYGHLLYVEERDQIKSKWLWVAAFVALPFLVALFGLVIAIDRIAPFLASNPIVFLFIIWAAAWLETRLMDQITEDYRPWGAPSESVE